MKTELIRAIGLELADIRRNKELSIIRVAKNTGLNKDMISKYENGNSSMKIYLLEDLVSYYGLNLAIFFKNVCENMHESNELTQELDELSEELDKEES